MLLPTTLLRANSKDIRTSGLLVRSTYVFFGLARSKSAMHGWRGLPGCMEHIVNKMRNAAVATSVSRSFQTVGIVSQEYHFGTIGVI